MPHICIEYSANLEKSVDIQALCDALRLSAAGLDIFPFDGVRVRALRAEYYAIADGDPANVFVDISVRLRAGRSDAAKSAATKALFAAAKDFLKVVIERDPIMLSLEMRDIDADLAPTLNTIRDRIGGPG